MDSIRKGYLYAKSIKMKQKGSALFQSVVFAIIVSVLITGLYFVFTKLFKSTQEIKSFTTVREAAAAGVKYGASMTNYPVEWQNQKCAKFYIEFRLYGRTELGITEIVVCRIGSISTEGQEITGVSREPTVGSANVTSSFKIIAISKFPANNSQQEARVESIYIR